RSLARRIQSLLRTNIASDRAQAFAIFLWQRFRDDRCPQSAGALAFTTLISLVPLTAAILGVLSSFPVFSRWQADLTTFVFDNFVPAAGRTVQAYLTEFANNASQATAVGIVVLIISAISLMMSIEDAFNRIWRVATTRTAASRFLMYWTALSFGPLLLVTALALSSYLFALPFVAGYEAELGIKARVLNLLPFLIVWVSLIASYLVIPNRTVRLRDAAIGALLAAALFEAAKRGFAFYLGTLTSYEQVYGALAVVPVFMLWIYLSWLVVLLGASVCAAISAFEYRGLHERLAPGHEFVGLLCVVNHFADAQRAGIGLHSEDLRARERFLTDDLLQRYLSDLHRAGMVQRTEFGDWVLARSLDAVTLFDLYESGLYRLPLTVAPTETARCRLPSALTDLVNLVAGDLQAALDVRLSEIFPPPHRSAQAALESPEQP
ncbi:MAG TPA: YihY family inner membrane protein, partial [Tahibacter sp.]|uniref:YihY family inner membrane protein n=1 Tax=Tahibacter sp. TaxID=2056211 RepID=UPI002BCD9A6C